MPIEIELGNGYGYFCNIHDIENQKPIVDQTYINNYRKYLEESERREHTSTHINDTVCSCSILAFIITFCICIL